MPPRGAAPNGTTRTTMTSPPGTAPLPSPREPAGEPLAGAADEPAGGRAGEQVATGPGLQASLEAILLVADEPVPAEVLAEVLGQPADEITAALTALSAAYTDEGRGFDLREIAGGWRFYTREECAAV